LRLWGDRKKNSTKTRGVSVGLPIHRVMAQGMGFRRKKGGFDYPFKEGQWCYLVLGGGGGGEFAKGGEPPVLQGKKGGSRRRSREDALAAAGLGSGKRRANKKGPRLLEEAYLEGKEGEHYTYGKGHKRKKRSRKSHPRQSSLMEGKNKNFSPGKKELLEANKGGGKVASRGERKGDILF